MHLTPSRFTLNYLHYYLSSFVSQEEMEFEEMLSVTVGMMPSQWEAAQTGG